MLKISVIIPCLNEAPTIVSLLESLQVIREKGHEVILCDGGSVDGTQLLATPLVDQLLQSEKGRALQMNDGASVATGDMFWFVHADSNLKLLSLENIDITFSFAAPAWGRFAIHLDAQGIIYRMIATMMNWRSCLTGIATGDQAIFVSRDLFKEVSGFSKLPLMEDVDLSKKLKRICRPHCLKSKIQTSARRWQRDGVVKTVFLMWSLRLAYFMGVPAERLKTYYL